MNTVPDVNATPDDETAAPSGRRRLSLWGFLVVVVVYLAIIQLGGRAASAIWNTSEDLTTTRDVLVNLWVPLGAAFVFTYAVVAFLRWRDPVLRDRRPTRRWVWVVPAILVVSILAATDYGALGDTSVGFVLALVVATQFVGWGEEGMFRGIGVTVLRDRGLSEGKVALWSSLIFGAVHLSNALGRGVSAVPQAIIVSFAGYFFYLTRRVSRGNAVNSVLHGFFDFSLLSGSVILVDQKAYVGSAAAILAYVAIAIVLLVRRHTIEPEAAMGESGT
jgi:hypothetical protein